MYESTVSEQLERISDTFIHILLAAIILYCAVRFITLLRQKRLSSILYVMLGIIGIVGIAMIDSPYFGSFISSFQNAGGWTIGLSIFGLCVIIALSKEAFVKIQSKLDNWWDNRKL